MYESRASRAGPGYTAVTQITSTKMAATKLHAKLGTYKQLFYKESAKNINFSKYILALFSKCLHLQILIRRQESYWYHR